MSLEERRKQTERAFTKVRWLWRNDPNWAAEHMRKVLEAQNYRETTIERIVQDWLDEWKIEYAPQYQVGRVFIDIALPQYKVAIECDGDYWHSRPEQIEKDKRKDKFLNMKGWYVVRLKESDIRTRPDYCKVQILERLLKLKYKPAPLQEKLNRILREQKGSPVIE